MKKVRSKRLLTLLLSALMCLGSIPTSAFAETTSIIGNTTDIEMLKSEDDLLDKSLEKEDVTNNTDNVVVEEESTTTKDLKNEPSEVLDNKIDTKLNVNYKFVLDTDGIDYGEKYLIMSSDGTKVLMYDNGSISELSSDNFSISGNEVTISSPSNIYKVSWDFKRSNNSATISNISKYLNPSATRSNQSWIYDNLSISTSGVNLTVNSKGSGSYEIYKNISSNNRTTKAYLTYNNKFTSGSSGTVKLYKQVVETAQDDTPINYVSFLATMYNYDKDTINPLSNFNFGPARDNNDYDYLNSYNNEKVTQGILESELSEDGYPQFTDNIDNGKIFSKEDNSLEGRRVYDGVQFPFEYNSTTGYYEFDSSKHHTHLNLSNDGTLSTENRQMKLYSGMHTVNGYTQFFPFNSHSNSESADHYFGMSLGVQFFMNENGTIDETTTGEPIKFDFSGDDDVWIFIDGKLVLDLGGIHDEASGSINFKTGEITYNQGRTDINGNSVTTNDNLNTIHNGAVSLANLADGEEHNLQIFYLERGANLSNCRIKFNLPQEEVLEVKKVLGSTTPVTTSDFKFKVEHKGSEDSEYEAYKGKEYTLYDGTSKIKTAVTAEDGTFTLKKNQTARFINPEHGDYIITEVEKNGYTAKWSTSKQSGSSTTNLGTSNNEVSPVINVEDSTSSNTDNKITVYTAICTNTGTLGLNPDVVVLDYGKPVKIDVLANDNLPTGSGASLSGLLSKGSVTTANVILGNGNIQAIIGDQIDEQYVEYTPTKFMDSIDTIKYNVTYNTDDQKGTASQQADIKIIPATTVYYEDNFGDGSLNEDDGTTNGIVFAVGNWGTERDENYNSLENKYQDSAQGPNATYGNDGSYETDSGFSYGSARVVTAQKGSPALAKFTFKGTGFDIISRTDNNTGHMNVKVYNSKNELVKNLPVNTVYETPDGILYQIPVISVTDLPYDTYRVMLTVTASTNSDGVSQPSTVYIDAIRLYNPIDPNGGDAEQANSAYKSDKEVNTVVNELRNLILRKADLDGSTTLPGIVYVDTDGNTAKVADYKGDGPNNELYLKPGTSIGFTLKTSTPASVKIGLKAPTGLSEVTIVSNGQSSDPIELSSATDMYYDITTKIKYNESKSHILIANTGDSDTIVSITNFKLTYDKTPAIQPELVSNKELADYAVSLTNSINNVENNDDSTGDEEENTNKPVNNKPGTNKPGTNKPSTNKPSNNKPSTNKPSNNKPSNNKPSTNKPSTSNPAVNKPSSSNTIGKFEETVQVDSSLDSLNKENVFVRIFDSIKNFVLAINSMIA